MALSEGDLNEIFRYWPPSSDQVAQYEELREAAKAFAKAILTHTPSGPDQTAAIRKVREAVMTANACIALGGRY